MREILKKTIRSIRSFPYRGSGRYCEICNATAATFLPFGVPRRQDAQCWRCHSLERHRFMWHFLRKEMITKLGSHTSFLHIAPEACLANRLKTLIGCDYLTADLFASGVDIKMDITNIQFAAETFDVICCSHVLEHVENDHKALREFLRVLKPGGVALLAVPITLDATYEDPSIVAPEERLRAFGQVDHVRCYGPDFIDRITRAGFQVRRVKPDEYMLTGDREVFGITDHAGDIFLAEKP